MLTLKVLAALLDYPQQELLDALDEMAAILESERALPKAERRRLDDLIADLRDGDLLDAQARYVGLFDHARSLSLHLYEHSHGESRDRGQAMVNLLQHYRAHGLDPGDSELPDYLPLFLEFLSTRPFGEAQDLLCQPLHVLAALRERLQKRKSVYATVFAALEALARSKPDAETLAALLGEADDDPHDLEALDRAWEDAPVTFGPSAGSVAPGGGCPAARASLARMDDGRG